MTIKVNGQPITREAVEFELNRLVQFYAAHIGEEKVQDRIGKLRRRAVEQAIGVRLLVTEAVHRNIVVDDNEVDGSLAEMVRHAGGDDELDTVL